MKVIQFTIPVAKEYAVIVQEDKLPYFYHHLHRHNETQITWILKGEGTLIAGNYMQPFKAGDIYIFGANQPHVFKSDQEYFDKRRRKQVHALTFFFNPDGLFKPVLALPELASVQKFISQTRQGLYLSGSAKPGITRDMLLVKDAKEGARLSGFIKLLHDMSFLRGWKKLAASQPDYTFSESEGLRMNDIYQFTIHHYNESIKLKQVADIACMTPQAFCRYFKKKTRKNYIVFLNEIRISEACKKIVSGEFDSISSVAYDTGFASAVSFNRVFKKTMGISPRQYQQQYFQKLD